MELRTTREMRRNEQLSKTMTKKAEADAPAQAKPAKLQAPADKVSVSRQALDWLEEQNQKMWEQERPRQDGGGGIWDAFETKEKELDALKEAMDAQEKCLKIAAAIMRGDRVPPEDLKYLMNNDPDGYKLALALRREKDDPEDCKSVLDDEDQDAPAEDAGGEAPAVSPSEGTSGGGASSGGEALS